MYERPFNPFAKNLAVVKEYFKSSSVLALAVTRAVTVLLTLITAIISINSISGTLNRIGVYLDELGLPSEFTEYWNEISSQAGSASAVSSIASTVPSLIVGVLVAAALFLIYFTSRNADPASSPQVGVTILYVLAILYMVTMIICAVFAVLVCVVLIWLASALGSAAGSGPVSFVSPVDGQRYQLAIDPSIFTVIAIVLSVCILIAMAVVLFYAVSMKRYYGSVKASITSVELQSGGAKPYGVMTIIFGVFAGLGLLSIPSSLISIGTFHLEGSEIALIILSALAVIAAFVTLVLEAKIALGYGKYIDNVKFGYGNQTPPAAPYAPVPGGEQNSAPADRSAGYTPDTNPYSDSYNSAAQSGAAQKPAVAPVCPSCGAAVDPNAPFCSKCGTKL